MSEEPRPAVSTAPPQHSPDGQWWWDGHQWIPAHEHTGQVAQSVRVKVDATPRKPPRLTKEQKIAGGSVGAGGIIVAVIGLVSTLYQTGVWGTHTPPTAPPSQPVPTQSAANAVQVWNVVLNRVWHTETLNGYVPNSPSDHHYLVVDLTFENTTSSSQVLNDQILDLQDSAGQHYSEGKATNPNQSDVVQDGQSTQWEVAYVIPDSVCHFKLYLMGNGSVQKSWDITSNYPGCG